jgi:hypothetical protein
MIERLGTLFAEEPPAAILVQGDTNTAAGQANYAGARSCTWKPVRARTTGPCRRSSTAAL